MRPAAELGNNTGTSSADKGGSRAFTRRLPLDVCDKSVGRTAAIQRIGFFHFGGNHDDPKESLKGALERREKEHGDLRDSLIVIPEAFNIPGVYIDLGRQLNTTDPDSRVLRFLKQESKTHRVSFVAGLIQQPSRWRRPGYSCACLIHDGNCKILSYKWMPDGSPHYRVHQARDEPEQDHRGIFVAALVCLDASQNITPGHRKPTGSSEAAR